MKTVLIIDDEKDLAETIGYNLKKEGFGCLLAHDGESGFISAKENLPDLILLDLMLPGIDGIEVFNLIKRNEGTSRIPVIMLTAKGEETDKVVGLELGADDYVTKPFGMKELMARIKTGIKRTVNKEMCEEKIFRFPDLEINIDAHVVKTSGKSVELTAKEFDLLAYLAKNKERVFTRNQLLDNVWDIDTEIETRTVDVHIRRLREKLKKAGKYIITLHGVGYKFSEKE
ncbi:MAG: winged helix-turn-helix domain-containing protein [Candidatus Margulisiibacteriota bacterium]